MLEKIIKKDKNEQLEKILEQKGLDIDEQAKNILQGILYKIEVSYKDYKKVKFKGQSRQKYIKELLKNIEKRCNKIKIIKPSVKVKNELIQTELEQNGFYYDKNKNQIISYPIETKLLYAIEKVSNYPKILNNKYEDATVAISDLINTGKNLDRVEVLRDFNGWSWTTINKEIENISANLIYQSLQIILGEEFMDKWTNDKDGIVDYLEQFTQVISKKYNKKLANEMKQSIAKIAIANAMDNNEKYKKHIEDKIKDIDNKIVEFEDSEKMIVQMTNQKKKMLKEINEIDKILGQNERLKEEYEKVNQNNNLSEEKIFSIKLLKQQLKNKKNTLLDKVNEINYLLKPLNYLEEKQKILEQKKKMQDVIQIQEKTELFLFLPKILKCFSLLIQKVEDEEEIFKFLYQFRYFLLLPFDDERKIKDVEEFELEILKIEKLLTQKAVKKKIINDVPLEIMSHVFKTRIIVLEELFYKVTKKDNKFYVQLFDENVSEEKFEIVQLDKMKINKKIKIFM